MKKRLLTLTLLISFVSLGQTKILIKEDLTKSLKVHNQERELLGLSKLKWCTDLQKDAENYAKYLARTDKFEHSQQNNQGENLYYEYNSESITKKPFERASTAWLDEKNDFIYSAIKLDDNFYKTGHYTQIIWAETNKVGIGAYVNSKGNVYVVARYSPRGNYIGKYPY